MNKIAKPIALCTALAGMLTGCAVPGAFGDKVAPLEARLIQQLVSESCVLSRNYKKIQIQPDDVRVEGIRHGSFEGEHIAYIGVSNSNMNFKYIRHAALVACDSGYYVPSPTLIEMGNDPYAHVKHRHAEVPNTFEYKDIYKLSVQWDGYDEELNGSIRMIGNSRGTIVVHLPNGQGSCIGAVWTPPKISYGLSWTIRCPMKQAAGGSGPTHAQAINPGVTGESNPGNSNQISFVVGELE